MKRYEYKTIELDLKGHGMFSPMKAVEFEDTLTTEGSNGWRYVDSILQGGILGGASRIKLVFEREIE